MSTRALLLTFLTVSVMACSSNPHYNPDKPHHTREGFRNIYYQDDKGLLEFLRWRFQRSDKERPEAEDYKFPIDTSNHAMLASNRDKATLTWVGHATFLLQLNGKNILTDPQFSDRASPFSWIGPKRVVAARPAIEQLPDIDFIILSHDHYDSTDLPSLRALAKHNATKPVTVIAPLGFKKWFDEQDINNLKIVELDWGDHFQQDGFKFTAEPCQHWGKRTLFDSFERLWASWVIEANDKRIYFAGDSGYSPHFKAIGEKYKDFDLALLPIGAYEPRWFMKSYHVNPEESVLIHRDVGSKYSVAMHWGTFILTDEPLTEPPVELQKAMKKYQLSPAEFEVYQHGETRFLPMLERTGK